MLDLFFFFPIHSHLTTFCASGICSISSFRGTGTSGTAGVEDTSIDSGRDMRTVILNAIIYLPSLAILPYLIVISLIYLGLNGFKCLLYLNLLPLSVYITWPSLLVIILFSQKLPPSIISEENPLYCRIHQLHLCRGVRPPPMSVLDMLLNNLRVRFQ